MYIRLMAFVSIVAFPLWTTSFMMTGCGGSGGLSAADLAISDAGDFDGDGILNADDPDDDNDGVLDADDIFPFDPEESADLDGDGVGDNGDDDADGDGVATADDCNDLSATTLPGGEDKPDVNYADTNCDGIDGDALDAVWVSTADGSDTNAGTIDAPVKTLAQAMALAATDPSNPFDVYVVAGTYPEDIELNLEMGLFGGFGPLADGVRPRDVATHVTTISGQAGGKSAVINLDSSSPVVQYTVGITGQTGTLNGMTLVGDADNFPLIIMNGSARVSQVIVESVNPVVPTQTIGVAIVADSASDNDHVIDFDHSTIRMKGAGDATRGSRGIVAINGKDYAHRITLNVRDSLIEMTGIAKDSIGVLAANDETSQVVLNVARNTFDLNVTGDAAVAVLGGYGNPLTSGLFPDSDQITIEQMTIEQNIIRIQQVGVQLAAWSGFSTQPSVFKNNTVSLVGGEDILLIGTFHGNLDVVHNSMYVQSDVVDNCYLVYSQFFNAPPYTDYGGRSIHRFDNNIISATCKDPVGSCGLVGYLGHEEADGVFHLANPESMRNNIFDFSDSNCTNQFVMIDDQEDDVGGTGSPVYINTVDNLNGKVGFAADDTMAVSGNLDDNPLFVDAEANNLRLQSDSPAIDAGVTLDDIVNDLLNVARPQGVGVDIGAYEQ